MCFEMPVPGLCDICYSHIRIVVSLPAMSYGVTARSVDLYPLLHNYDVWREIVGINWKTMACEWCDYLHSSSFFLRVSAVFHCLFFCKVSSVVFLSCRIVLRSDGN